jgi:thiol-disulfide isomerase/thioredoxin
MTKLRSITLPCLCVTLAIAVSACAQTTAPSGRTPEVIADELTQAVQRFHDDVQGGQALRSAETRKAVAPKALPDLHSAMALLNELVAVQPEAKDDLDGVGLQYRVMAILLDDTEETATATGEAGGTDVSGARAKAALAIANYLKAADDAARTKALDAYGVALKAAPEDAAVLGLFVMTAMAAPPSGDVYKHMIEVMKSVVASPDAQQIALDLQDNLTRRQLLNKPLVIEGPTLDNPKFTTAAWKGKVVLVDFWATWCGPCIEELPRVKQMYAQYHDKGLEILGVSCDHDPGALKKFLARNPDMTWPQLFDEKSLDWNPVADALGVHGIPMMYVIDRKGIVRTVDGRRNMETLIPQLLAEKP